MTNDQSRKSREATGFVLLGGASFAFLMGIKTGVLPELYAFFPTVFYLATSMVALYLGYSLIRVVEEERREESLRRVIKEEVEKMLVGGRNE